MNNEAWFWLSPRNVSREVGPHWASEKSFVCEADCDASALLISAAPDLLRVAKGALGYLQSLPASHRPDEAWLKPLRAAISRAEGA